MMIWTIKIQLLFGLYAEEKWESTVEVDSTSTLEDIHYVIQSAVEFDNDHMYEFYTSRTERSRDRVRFDNHEKLFPNTPYDISVPRYWDTVPTIAHRCISSATEDS